MNVQLTCPYCQFSKDVPEERIPPNVKRVTCPRCRQRFDLSNVRADWEDVTEQDIRYTGREGSEKDASGDSGRTGAPWEKRSEIGLWQGIYQTFKTVVFSPGALFGTLRYNGGMREPFAFGLLVGSIGTMAAFFWQFLLLSKWLSSYLDQVLAGQFAMGLIFALVMAVAPVYITVAIFISSAIWHVLLLLFRGGGNGFEATFRVISYTQAAKFWGIIPFVGSWIAFIWELIVQIVGLREIHETTYARVILAFVIPVIAAFVLMVTLIFALFISQMQ